jgi:hypothetical protein
MTFKQQIDAALIHARAARAVALTGETKAEFTLAIRHLEDAGMRFNRAVAIGEGVLTTADLEAP